MKLNYNRGRSAARVCSRLILLFLMSAIIHGCSSVKYSFSGASIPPGTKTVSVQYFQNRASLVQVGLSEALTNALIDKCKAETNLTIINGLGDVNFEGEITDYSTKPQTVSADAVAASNRFTITVKVKFTNAINPDLSYEQTFSRYMDYDGSLDFSQVGPTLSTDIIELIVEDIFNAAFVNW